MSTFLGFDTTDIQNAIGGLQADAAAAGDLAATVAASYNKVVNPNGVVTAAAGSPPPGGFQPGATSVQTPNNTNPWEWVKAHLGLVVGGTVAIIGLGVALVLLLRKRK